MCGCLTGDEPVFIFLYCVWGWFAVLFPKVCWVACFVLGVLACFAGAVALWPLCTINYSHFSVGWFFNNIFMLNKKLKSR